MQRARKTWIYLFLIACVVAIAVLFTCLRTSERPCSLAIQFIGFANDAMQTYGVFIVTNRSDVSLQFRALTETKANGSWPVYPIGTPLLHTGPYDIPAHQSRELRTPLPTNGTPFRMSIACLEPWTRSENARWSVSVWFRDHKLPGIGELVSEGKHGHLILSSEIQK